MVAGRLPGVLDDPGGVDPRRVVVVDMATSLQLARLGATSRGACPSISNYADASGYEAWVVELTFVMIGRGSSRIGNSLERRAQCLGFAFKKAADDEAWRDALLSVMMLGGKEDTRIAVAKFVIATVVAEVRKTP